MAKHQSDFPSFGYSSVVLPGSGGGGLPSGGPTGATSPTNEQLLNSLFMRMVPGSHQIHSRPLTGIYGHSQHQQQQQLQQEAASHHGLGQTPSINGYERRPLQRSHQQPDMMSVRSTGTTQDSPNSENQEEQPLDFSKKPAEPMSPGDHRTHRMSEEYDDEEELEADEGPEEEEEDEDEATPRDLSKNGMGTSTTSTATTGSLLAHPMATNCYTTPSPSPPEQQPQHHPRAGNQVLCQLLAGGNGSMLDNNRLTGSPPVPITSPAPSARGPQHPGGAGALVNGNGMIGGFGGRGGLLLSPIAPNAAQCGNSAGGGGGGGGRHHQQQESISPLVGHLSQIAMNVGGGPSPGSASGVDRFGTSGGLLTTTTNSSSTPTVRPIQGALANGALLDARKSVKYTRPFKAYTREPISMPMGYCGGLPLQLPGLSSDAIATQSLLATASDQQYVHFREQMMQQRRSQDCKRRPVHQPGGQAPTSDSTQNGGGGGGGASICNINNNNISKSNNNHISMELSRSQYKMEMSPPSMVSSNYEQKPITNSHGSISVSTALALPVGDDGSQMSNVSNSSSGGEHEGGLLTDESFLGPGLLRKRGRPLPEDLKDEAYWERRRKNNEAAKRSRDARRAKEDEIAIRAAFLEQENLKLRVEVASLKSETAKLRCLMYNN